MINTSIYLSIYLMINKYLSNFLSYDEYKYLGPMYNICDRYENKYLSISLSYELY